MGTAEKDNTKSWLLKRWWVWGLILVGLGVLGAFSWSESSSRREATSKVESLTAEKKELESAVTAYRENNIRLQVESANYKAKYETAVRESAKWKTAALDAQGQAIRDADGRVVFNEGSNSMASSSSQTQELQHQVQTLTEENKAKDETIQRQATTITSQSLTIETLKESESKKRDGMAIILGGGLDTRELPGISARGFTGLGATLLTVPLLDWELKAAVGGIW